MCGIIKNAKNTDERFHEKLEIKKIAESISDARLFFGQFDLLELKRAPARQHFHARHSVQGVGAEFGVRVEGLDFEAVGVGGLFI